MHYNYYLNFLKFKFDNNKKIFKKCNPSKPSINKRKKTLPTYSKT